MSYRLVIGAAVLLATATIVLGLVVRSRILAEFDQAISAKATALASLISREGRFIEVDLDDGVELAGQTEGGEEYFLAQFENGDLIRRSDDWNPDWVLPDLDGIHEGLGFEDVILGGEVDRARLMRFRFTPRFDEDEDEVPEEEILEDPEYEELFRIPDDFDPRRSRVIISLVKNRAQLDQLLAYLGFAAIAIDGALLVGIAMLTRLSLKKGFRPIESLNQQIVNILPGTPEQRLSLSSPPAELQAVINALNDLLGKVEDAFARERRFSSAVAHELRTPVSELRMACEAGRMLLDDAESTERLFGDTHDIALHMERIVSNLLELARCDSKTLLLATEEFSVADIVRDCWRRSLTVATSRSLNLDDQVDPKRRVIADKAKVEIVFQNLIDNAVSHSVGGSVIIVASNDERGALVVSVENETDNVTDDDLIHLFERFWRKDSNRGDQSHAGLGLSLVKALCDLMDIRIRVSLPDGKRFRVELRFPRAVSSA